jgi:uncharacterized protein YdaU (DUF1376 family)
MRQPQSLFMMPWFPRDFMSSTRGWPLIARGAYRELLDAQWDMGELPIDQEELRLLCGATETEWATCWPRIEPKFPVNCAGRKNPRLEIHRQKAQTLYAQRALGARTANALRTHPSPSPSPSPSPNQSPEQSKSEESKTWRTKRATRELDKFIDVQNEYPKRAGGQRWGEAKSAYAKHCAAGISHDEILAGVRRYAAFIRAKGDEGTQYVQQAATFLGRNEGWRELWNPPLTKGEVRQKSNIDAAHEWLESSNDRG